VSHHGFLRNAISNLRFENADYRIFDLVDMGLGNGVGQDGKDWALDAEGMLKGRWILREWERTAEKGGGMGWSDVGRVGIEEGDFPEEPVSEGTGDGEVGEQQ
jgi:hypothetical protein